MTVADHNPKESTTMPSRLYLDTIYEADAHLAFLTRSPRGRLFLRQLRDERRDRIIQSTQRHAFKQGFAKAVQSPG